MYRIDIYRELTPDQQNQIGCLIYRSWVREAEEHHDVQVIVGKDQTVYDPLDRSAWHVTAWKDNDTLVGYARLSLVNPFLITNEFDEVKLPSFLETSPMTHTAAYASRLVVDPNQRGQGVGRLLINTRIQLAKELDASVIYGWAVGEKSRSALAEAGFTEVLERQGFSTPWYRTKRKTRLVKLDLTSASSTLPTHTTGQQAPRVS